MNATKRHDETMVELWNRCREWNDTHLVGTAVLVIEQDTAFESITSAPAHVIGSEIFVTVEGSSSAIRVDSLVIQG